MRSNNDNKAITHLAMPERQIPILIDSSPEKAEGYVPLVPGNHKPVTNVRRFPPSFMEELKSPKRRQEIEREHGTINATEWARLRELLALIDRLNAGDWEPVITTNPEGALEQLPALLDQLSPGGWRKEKDQSEPGRLSFTSISDGRRKITFDIGKFSIAPIEDELQVHRDTSRLRPVTKLDGKTTVWSGEFNVIGKTAICALSEAFTEGLSKTRFVVWWAKLPKKLVPGLYCPDIVTALYASVLYRLGTPGGLGVCKRCGEDFIRARARQLYCDHKCQVAAAMKRHRINLKLKAESASKAPTKTKKHKREK